MSAGVRWDIMVPYTMSMNNNVFLDPTALNPAANNLSRLRQRLRAG